MSPTSRRRISRTGRSVPNTVEGARRFLPAVSRAFDDPRSHIHINDARTYFAAQQSSYDIIISEPSNPWVSGVSGLFSVEFYRLIERHLADGGVLAHIAQEVQDANAPRPVIVVHQVGPIEVDE